MYLETFITTTRVGITGPSLLDERGADAQGAGLEIVFYEINHAFPHQRSLHRRHPLLLLWNISGFHEIYFLYIL